MKIEGFKKLRKEVEEEIRKNNKKLSVYDEKKRINDVNSFEYKLCATIMFSTLGYLAIFLYSTVLMKSSFINFFTNLNYPFIVLGGSFGIGSIINKLMNMKYKTKERFKFNSNASTELEKLEEIVHYEIECKKLKNKNEVLRQVIDIFNADENMLRKISEKYTLTHNNNLKTIQDIFKNIEELNSIIEKKYARLDDLSIKMVLHCRFWRVRSMFEQIFNFLVVTLMSGTFSTLYVSMPLFFIKRVSAGFNLSTVILGPFIASIIGASVYIIKRNKNYKKVFNKFNRELNDNALISMFKKYDDAYRERKEINKELEKQIKDISEILVELKYEEQRLDAILCEEEIKTKNKNKEDNKFIKHELEEPLNINNETLKKEFILQRKK